MKRVQGLGRALVVVNTLAARGFQTREQGLESGSIAVNFLGKTPELILKRIDQMISGIVRRLESIGRNRCSGRKQKIVRDVMEVAIGPHRIRSSPMCGFATSI